MADEITRLAGQIAAATARFLVLLGRFDEVGGWGGVGIRSLPHWLSWRAGMSLRTARDHVRVARALRELPLISAAFGRGELSFSKVRALTRVATAETEHELLMVALNSPAAHIERLVAGLQKVRQGEKNADDGRPDAGDDNRGDSSEGAPDAQGGDGVDDESSADDTTADDGRAGQPTRSPREAPPQRLQWRWDEDSDELVVWGRFGPADGKVILAALTRAELDRVRTLAHDGTDDAESDASNDTPVGEPSPDHGDGAQEKGDEMCEQRIESVDRTAMAPSDAGPALVAMAQIALAAQQAPMVAPSAEVLFLHQQPPALRHECSAEHSLEPGCSAEQSHRKGCAAEHHPDSPTRTADRAGSVSVDDGPALEPDAAQELLCGADSRCVLTGAEGAVLAYGKKRRAFSAAQIRALRLRDRGCRTPGCQRTRFLHAHHVIFWSEGGGTDLDNAILLCSGCHRAVHLGRLRIVALGGQRFRFSDARTGKILVDAPPMFGLADDILADRTIMPTTVTGGWWGEPLDLSYVSATLISQWQARDAWPARPDEQVRPWSDDLRPAWARGSDAA